MLTIYLLSVLTSFWIISKLSMVLNTIKRNKSIHEPKSSVFHSETQYISDSENMGAWNLTKFILVSMFCVIKDPTHHDTVYEKLYAFLNKASLKKAKLKSKLFGLPLVVLNNACYILKIIAPNSNLVIAQSEKSIREYLCNENCSNRLPDKLHKLINDEQNTGILLGHANANWKELRKYTVKTLGKLGFGSMSLILDDALTDILEKFELCRTQEGNKIPVHNFFSLSVVNVVWEMIGGSKFKQTDEKFHKLIDHLQEITNATMLANWWASTFPKFILNIMKSLGIEGQSVVDWSTRGQVAFMELIGEIEMREIRSEINCYENMKTDFVTQFLSQIENYKDDEKMSKIYCKPQLAAILNDLFSASIDTTGKFMESFFMYMVMYPDVQERMYQEIMEVVGNSTPSYASHNKSMPYTLAVIMEIHRMVNIVPIPGRTVIRNCKIGNDVLKKDGDVSHFILFNFIYDPYLVQNTLILPVQSFMNMDQTFWGDANVFRPERFLDEKNNILTDKVIYLMPFGAGIRVCPGENVAKATIFTFTVGILQRYILKKSNQDEFVGLSKGLGITRGPEQFHASLFFR